MFNRPQPLPKFLPRKDCDFKKPPSPWSPLQVSCVIYQHPKPGLLALEGWDGSLGPN